MLNYELDKGWTLINSSYLDICLPSIMVTGTDLVARNYAAIDYDI